MLWYFKVILVAILLNSDGSYKAHEFIEVPGTIHECEEDKPEDRYNRDGTMLLFRCVLIAGA